MSPTDAPSRAEDKPRLLFYTHALEAGGAERVWAQLATAFKQDGYDTFFVVDRDADACRPLLDPRIPVIVLAAGQTNAVRDLARVLAEVRPTVALAAVGGSNLKLVAAERLARSGAGLVISYHGFSEWRTGKLSLATYLALPWLSRTTARTVAVSDGLRRALVSRWGASRTRTIAIPNPVQLPDQLVCARHEAELRSRPPVILSVGRLVPEKDFPTLLRAFAQIVRPAKNKVADARLVILGEGRERAALEALIHELGIAAQVAMPGHQEPWRWYGEARCFALASWSEAFGNVVVEALAHGLPVVATRSGGPDEILAGGRYGRLVPSGNVDTLAAALADALADPGPPAPRIARAAEFSFARGFAAYRRMLGEVAAETAER